MKCNRTIAVAAFLLFLTLEPKAGAQDSCARPRLISVTGTAEVNVAPDEAILSLGVESRDKDLGMAKSRHDKHVRQLMALARKAGVEGKDIQTSALRMGPNYSEEKVPRLLGYEVSQTIDMTLRDLSKYEALMTNLLIAGVDRVQGIQFVVTDPKKYREEARVRAIRAARDKAVVMAAELGQTVGKPWEISEGFNDNGMLFSANAVSRYNTAPAVQEDSTVAPGMVTIRAWIRVSFLLD